MTEKKPTANDLQLWFDFFENTPEEQNALKAFIEKEKAIAREEGRQEAAKEIFDEIDAKSWPSFQNANKNDIFEDDYKSIKAKWVKKE